MLAAGFLLTGCGGSASDADADAPQEAQTEETAETEAAEPEANAASPDPVLLYMGHASIRIVTGEDKVIYIDPYAGEGYDLPADLILVTHDHYDHNSLGRIPDRKEDCTLITQAEALESGTFALGYVSVEAVEAGNNEYHDINECVGYVLTFSNDKKVYVSGDTSKTDQMADLADQGIDYAFFCCDGVYNMDLEEAAECAELVQAKHNIPYHIVEAEDPEHFDMERAERFPAPDKLILQPGEELTIE
ncbi:MAG: MBL fold metallo-hydrolase [Firmicutes bacterium]|nr:MBL fold metallo-hydrolase [Bacillota bacterium]